MHLARPAAALALLLAACGGDEEPADPGGPELAAPARVTGVSPFAPGCGAPGAPGTRYPDSEVEPHLAVHPLNPDHLVAAWQQDRWSNGGADGVVAAVSLDGGATWTASPLPFSACAGGEAPGGDYERATDPWVTFSADGSLVHAVGLALDGTSPREAIVTSRSTDGGLSWEAPRVLVEDASADVLPDKPTITADPARAGHVYAVWDRLTGLASPDPATGTGPAWLSRSTDGGVTWEAPRVLHDPGEDAQTISSQIVALPGGALVNVFVRILGTSGQAPSAVDVVASRSDDAGETWSGPVVVAPLRAVGAVDPDDGHPIRSGEVVPSSAVDPSGRIWVAWQDARFTAGVRDGIALAVSEDGGATWSAPARVNRAPLAQAFRPAVAAAPDGSVAVTYYDLRLDVPGGAGLRTAFWRAITADGGATWSEVPEGGAFDLRAAPDAGGLFLGDYTGLVARAGGFTALFSMSASPGVPGTDAFVSGPPLPIVAAPAVAQRNARPLPFAERLRAARDLPPR